MGGHYINATKQTQTVDLFGLIIVLKSVRIHFAYGSDRRSILLNITSKLHDCRRQYALTSMA